MQHWVISSDREETKVVSIMKKIKEEEEKMINDKLSSLGCNVLVEYYLFSIKIIEILINCIY